MKRSIVILFVLLLMSPGCSDDDERTEQCIAADPGGQSCEEASDCHSDFVCVCADGDYEVNSSSCYNGECGGAAVECGGEGFFPEFAACDEGTWTGDCYASGE